MNTIKQVVKNTPAFLNEIGVKAEPTFVTADGDHVLVGFESRGPFLSAIRRAGFEKDPKGVPGTRYRAFKHKSIPKGRIVVARNRGEQQICVFIQNSR